MSHVLVGDIIAGAAEVCACLAVNIIYADGVRSGFEHVCCSVGKTVIEAVRLLVIQRKDTEILDEFAVDIPFRCDVVGTGKAVGLADVSDRTVCFHGIRMEFPLIRNLVNIGGVSDRHVFIFAPVHYDIFPHGIEGVISGIVVHGAGRNEGVQIESPQLGSDPLCQLRILRLDEIDDLS